MNPETNTKKQRPSLELLTEDEQSLLVKALGNLGGPEATALHKRLMNSVGIYIRPSSK